MENLTVEGTSIIHVQIIANICSGNLISGNSAHLFLFFNERSVSYNFYSRIYVEIRKLNLQTKTISTKRNGTKLPLKERHRCHLDRSGQVADSRFIYNFRKGAH